MNVRVHLIIKEKLHVLYVVTKKYKLNAKKKINKDIFGGITLHVSQLKKEGKHGGLANGGQ